MRVKFFEGYGGEIEREINDFFDFGKGIVIKDIKIAPKIEEGEWLYAFVLYEEV